MDGGGSRALRGLSTLADSWFGTDQPAPGPGRRWLLRYLGVAALLAAVIVARRPDAVTTPQFWAEDGYVFFVENLTLGPRAALAKGYQGFPYLVHRGIAAVGGMVPVVHAPRVYTLGAILLTALALASFALPGFRHLVRNDGLRVLFGIGVLCAPFDQEVLATPTNLGWFLAVWLSLLSLMRLPRRPASLAGLALAAGVVIFSTPLAVLNVPLWIARVWHAARRRDRRAVCFWAVLLAGEAAVLALTRLGGADTRDFGQRSGEFLWICVGFALDRVVELAWPGAGGDGLYHWGHLGMLGLVGLLCGLLLAAAAAARYRTLPGLLVAAGLFWGSLLATIAGRPVLAFLRQDTVPDRYLIYPAAMFVLCVVIAVDGLPTRWLRGAAGAVAAGLLAWGWLPFFRIEPLIDQDWPRHAALLERKLASGSRAPLVIRANPPYAPLRFDPVDWFPQPELSGTQVIAGLGSHGMFRQRFRCGCNDLTTIEMRLGAAAASSRGLLRFALIEDGAREPVVRLAIPRAEMTLQGGWQPFAFAPITRSAGKGYTIVLRAEDNDVDASIWVIGSDEDRYPDGAPTFLGKPLPGDAAFRYGCLRPPP